MRNDYLNQKSLRVAVYCRVATDTQVTDQAKDIVGERRETMTGQQLEQIAALRRKNYPYSFIGRELGLSPNTTLRIRTNQLFLQRFSTLFRRGWSTGEDTRHGFGIIARLAIS